jgi:copper chaperone
MVLDLPKMGRFTVKLLTIQEVTMYQFKVEKMSCGGCAASVKRAVQSVDLKAQAEVDLAAKQVKVLSEAAINTVQSAIANAGYPIVHV